jgi:small subunit ribosomal protein S8
MTLNDPLANLFSVILNSEKVGKRTVTIKPINKLMLILLDKLKEIGYVGEYELTDDTKGKYMKLHLLGKINKCGVIKPRYAVATDEFQKFEKRYLPAKNIGLLLMSTSQGIMTHEEAKQKKVGGRLIAYCY